MPVPSPIAELDPFGGYTLIADADVYKAFHFLNRAYVATPPKSYPCFAMEVFTAQEDTYYHYLYPEDLARMSAAIAAVAEAPDPALT